MGQAELEHREFIKRAAIASQQGMLATDSADFSWSDHANHEEMASTAMDMAETLYREIIRRYGPLPEA